ncbi:heavy-metal-associated domain-containing protein [Tissierella creatinophila]|nr:heavy-metal-associated domain-containing protein [Tissierella creatinophila]
MKKKITIEGITSSYCITHITDILKDICGVINVWINLDEKNAIIKLDFNIDDNKLSTAINNAGYKTIIVKSI